MKKEDLIHELVENKEDSFAIFSKGYLEHFDLDANIFSHLLPKLIKESSDLLFINDTIVDMPEMVSDEITKSFKEKSQQIYDVVQELCLEEVTDLPYVAACSRILADKASPAFLQKVKNKLDQGYKFQQSLHDGSLEISDPHGAKVFSSAFVPMKEILKELGLDTTHPQYSLFYFGLFPKEEIYTYRLAYSFKVAFQF